MKRALSLMRKDADIIIKESIKAVDPICAVEKMVRITGDILYVGNRKYNLKKINNIYIVGLGKASSQMAIPLEKILGKKLAGGIINTKYGHGAKLKKLKINECGHPVPDKNGLKGAGEICRFVERAGKNDIVFCLISGGGSALFPLPAKEISFRDKQKTTQLLLKSGAAIQEVNTVRKHISAVKGGRLAKIISPAKIISLILSDVIGDDIAFIASGVTAPDPTTFLNCMEIMKKYKLQKSMPESVIKYIREGLKKKALETPKPGDDAFKEVKNLVIGSNFAAAEAAAKKAEKLGYNALILSTIIEGETSQVAGVHAAIAKEILMSNNPVKKPACVISGGETTVTIKGKGKGGRNMEFCLACIGSISGCENIVISSVGTDGTDGPTDAAGAIVDSNSCAKAMKKKLMPLKYLDNNDSYNFFKKAGGLYITGPTGTNVMDIRVMLVK